MEYIEYPANRYQPVSDAYNDKPNWQLATPQYKRFFIIHIYMRKDDLDKLIEYITKEGISAPEFKFDGRSLHIISPVFNYGSIITLILIPLIIVLIQKVNLLVGLLLLGAAVYSLWYDFESVNSLEIDLDDNRFKIRRRSPFLKLFFSTNQNVSFSLTDIRDFSYKSTQQKPSFRRYRFYVTLINGDDFLFSDIESEERAKKIVLFLNNAFK